MIAINQHSSKLKVWSVEMPNAPYSNRCDVIRLSRRTFLLRAFALPNKRNWHHNAVLNQIAPYVSHNPALRCPSRESVFQHIPKTQFVSVLLIFYICLDFVHKYKILNTTAFSRALAVIKKQKHGKAF